MLTISETHVLKITISALLTYFCQTTAQLNMVSRSLLKTFYTFLTNSLCIENSTQEKVYFNDRAASRVFRLY